jgi:hypothetical protein
VTHPSEPNYIAMISGSNWWTNTDSPANRFDHTNLVDELEASHISWGAYMEALPADPLADFWPSSANPPAIVIDPSGPRHFTSNVPYNHYSMLRTIEDAWNLPELAFTSDHAQVSTMNEFLTR